MAESKEQSPVVLCSCVAPHMTSHGNRGLHNCNNITTQDGPARCKNQAGKCGKCRACCVTSRCARHHPTGTCLFASRGKCGSSVSWHLNFINQHLIGWYCTNPKHRP